MQREKIGGNDKERIKRSSSLFPLKDAIGQTSSVETLPISFTTLMTEKDTKSQCGSPVSNSIAFTTFKFF